MLILSLISGVIIALLEYDVLSSEFLYSNEYPDFNKYFRLLCMTSSRDLLLEQKRFYSQRCQFYDSEF